MVDQKELAASILHAYIDCADGKAADAAPTLECLLDKLMPVTKDGNQWRAVWFDFVNLQESPAGFSPLAPYLAREALLEETKNG